MTTAAVIVLGILTWILVAIPLALFVARMIRPNRPGVPAIELAPESSAGKPVLDAPAEPEPTLDAPAEPKAVIAEPKRALDVPAEPIARFPAEPARFVGRIEVMAAASAALDLTSGCSAVVFHGMAGVGKTTCAVELAYRHQHDFGGLAFWSAPTDTDQFGDALRLLAVALETQLGDHGLTMTEEIVTSERLENFLPTLTAVLTRVGVLLVLDNLGTLLTPDGQWRDRRWASLIGALTSCQGPSRLILTSRVVPAGLDSDTVLIQPVPALSRAESLRLVRRLPHLHALQHTGAPGRAVLTVAQGHPTLLELAGAAAADPSRLAYQLTEIEAAVDKTVPLAEFLTQGHTTLDVEQLRQIFTTWVGTVAATVPAPARLLLQALCRAEEPDRCPAVLGANWAALWRRLDQPGAPPPLASSIAPLVTTALTAIDPIDDSADSSEAVRYRIHPAIAEAINATTPEPVTAAVDAQLGIWWTTVLGSWEIEQQLFGNNTSRSTVRAGLAAARYLLRQHDWNAASCLLERALIRDSYSPVTSLAVLPLLQRIAEASGAGKYLVMLGAAFRKVDPGKSETLLRRAYDQAATEGEYGLASTTAGDLVTLLRDQGRFAEALTLAGQKVEHTSQAGFGAWTQLSDQGRRLQILGLLDRHEEVLLDLPALRARMARLPDQRADNDRVNPWNVREGILDVGRLSAVALERWGEALDLNEEITRAKRRRGAGTGEIARTRFNDYLPLLRLGELTDVDHLLRDCQDVFDTSGDNSRLAVVHAARADLENRREHPMAAVDLQRTALRLCYVRPDPREISTAHHHLANYLFGACGTSAEQRAHRLTASLLDHLTGDTSALARTLTALATELHSDTSSTNTPTFPTTVSEVIGLVDADDSVRFGDLLVTLCPNPTTAKNALTELLTTATQSADRPRR
ncbi:MAG TPA: hypothetical protein VHH34_19790 [Pseudonocardiaceae bacterium]|nr:hypothetical protein [Pseudonocardiaceae bacterium]